MGENRKQHIVPQCYLNNFTYSSKEPYKIYALQRNSKKIFETNIRDSAEQKDFYTIPDNLDPFVWDKEYQGLIEPLLSKTVSNIVSSCEEQTVNNKDLILDAELKSNLIICMVFQLLRDKHSRDRMKIIFDTKYDDVIKSAKKRFPQISYNYDTINKEKLFMEDAMLASLNITYYDILIKMLCMRTYYIIKIVDNYCFITSDSPIVIMNSSTLDTTPYKTGISATHSVIYFPISPKLTIASFHPQTILGFDKNLDGRVWFIEGKIEHDFINKHNKWQFEHCYMHAYSNNRECLENVVNNE